MKYNLISAIRSNSTRRRLAGAFGLLLALGLLAAMAFPMPILADAPPALPQNFAGDVTINGSAAPAGTMVYAKIGGVVKAEGQVNDLGRYGDPMGMFYVSGTTGGNIDFYVGTTFATSTPFLTGEDTELDLAVTVVENPKYDLTVTADAQSSVTVGALGTVLAGQTSTFNDLAENTQVVLTGNVADACYQWQGWNINGSSYTANPYTVTMTQDTIVYAYSQAKGPYQLTVNVNPAAGGSVTPGSGSYACGTVVTLHYTVNADYEFAGWSGAAAGTANDVQITMNSNKSVTATFNSVLPPNPDDIPGKIMDIPLAAGWNTFSVPIKLDTAMDTWGEFTTINELDYQIVYGYNAQAGIWVQMTTNDPVQAMDGYYIKMNSAGIAQVVPYPENSSQPIKYLYAGLNLVGVASLQDVDVVSYLTTVYTVNNNGVGYQLVHNPPVNSPGDWNNDIYIRDSATVPTLVVGKAYWVYMLNPGNLVGFTSTPLD